jgi:AbiU2
MSAERKPPTTGVKQRNQNWPMSLSVEERVSLAKDKINKIIDHVCLCIALNESNAILNYSKSISGQIGSSHAAHTFALLQNSQHRYELMRLCALWDAPGRNRESIPTVAALIDDQDVISALVRETESLWEDVRPLPHSDGIDPALQDRIWQTERQEDFPVD